MTATAVDKDAQRRQEELEERVRRGEIFIYRPISPVGDNLDNDDNDVRNLRTLIDTLTGTLPDQRETDHQGLPLGMMTRGLETNIRKFQQDNDLKNDGIVLPGGETAEAINQKIAEVKSKKEQPAVSKPSQTGPVPQEPGTVLPPPPDYRKEVFKGERKKEWEDFYKTLESRNDLSAAEKRQFQDIFAAEGGMATHPDSNAHAGILPSTLDDHIKQKKLPLIVSKHGDQVKNTQLDMDDVIDVYKSHLNDTMASAALGYNRANPNNPKTGTQLLGELGDKVGGAVTDTLFKNAGAAGSEMVIKAINKNLPDDKKLTSPTGIGSKAYQALKDIQANPAKTKSFLESLAVIRVIEEQNGQNEKDRIYSHTLRK